MAADPDTKTALTAGINNFFISFIPKVFQI